MQPFVINCSNAPNPECCSDAKHLCKKCEKRAGTNNGYVPPYVLAINAPTKSERLLPPRTFNSEDDGDRIRKRLRRALGKG